MPLEHLTFVVLTFLNYQKEWLHGCVSKERHKNQVISYFKNICVWGQIFSIPNQFAA